MTPAKLTGKEFESAIMDSLARGKREGVLTGGRYGVQVSMIDGKWQPVPSLPDFEGCLASGRQWIIEAKCCAGASFALAKNIIKPRQVSHMLDRSAFGALCFVLIHFAERRMATKNDPAITVALPVNDSVPIWREFVDGCAKAKRTSETAYSCKIPRDQACDLGQLVIWNAPKGCRKTLPDLQALLSPETIQPTLL